MIQGLENLVRARKSVRTFAEIKIEPKKIELICDYMKANSTGIFGNEVGFSWIDGNSDELKNVKLGTYGVISGTKSFVTGKITSSEKNFEDFGFCMEKLVLYCTQLNLGTCWLGGTYRKTVFATLAGLKPNELMPAVIPVGYAGRSKSTVDKLFRHFAGSDNRKPFDELFFSGNFLKPLSEKEKSEFGYFLEMVRLAPSASNKQPWRIVLAGNIFHFYLKRTPNYNNKLLQSDLQRVDMGIGMAHFDLALNERGINHRWITVNPGFATDGLTEYIAGCELL